MAVDTSVGSGLPPSIDALAAIGERILSELPEAIRELLGPVPVMVRDWPDEALLDALEIGDPLELTGLYQRRRFDRELDELLARARNASAPLGMLVLDLDGLKAINDTHGHLFGAYVIAESGKLIGRVLPEGAIAARFGGDEYVVACPDHDLEAVVGVVERIHRAVAELSYEREGVRLAPGISIGVAAFPVHAKDRESLFSCADRALYASKRAGRNRVSVYEP